MLILKGILKQNTPVKSKKDETVRHLVKVETQTEKQDGLIDYDLKTMMLTPLEASNLPENGSEVSFEVNAWANGKSVSLGFLRDVIA